MRHFSAWIFVIVLLLGGAATGQAQGVAFGDWQLYLPAQHPLVFADAGTRLYVADESSFYFYDKTTNSTQQLSRRDGLSDVGVRALAYDSASAQLVVVYTNGNIDIVGSTGTVRNVTDLLRKAQAVKTINQVQIYNGLAYINTALGVVVLDLAKLEVRDTYAAIGPGGASINAYATVVLHDTIFAATSQGLLRGRISSAINLLDYRSWTAETPVAGAPTQAFFGAEAYRGHLYVASNFRGLDYLAGVGTARAWRNAAGSYGNNVLRLRASAGSLLFTFGGADVRRFNAATGQVATVLPAAAVGAANDVVRQADGTYFVASYTYGLLRFGPGITTNPEVIKPNGPATAYAFGLLTSAATNTVDVFPGAYSGDDGLQKGYRLGFYEYQGGQWTNYNTTNYPSSADFPNLLDLSHGTRTPDGTLYIASYGNGLLQWKGVGQYKQYTAGTAGSPLRSSLDPDLNNLDYVRVTDVAADQNNGRVWVVNRHQRTNVPGLLRLRPSTGVWDMQIAAPGFENLDRLALDNYGNPWATASRKGGTGLVAYDTTSRTPFYFSTANGLPSNTLYSITRDRSGDIWVGTGAGVAYFSDPGQLVGGANTGKFTTPVVTKGTGTGFQVLYNEAVTCIATDGANRKWFGTANGLWLFSADAKEALLHFTTLNSPLPSNGIVDVAVNDKTGEVFVATNGGLVSYHGSATLTDSAPSCAAVYPNPVRPDFVGTVGINGVVNNAYVKITDIAGHLVYSTRATGGTVTWNLADTDGRRVRSGVYLVLTSDADGKNPCVSKVAVLSN